MRGVRLGGLLHARRSAGGGSRAGRPWPRGGASRRGRRREHARHAGVIVLALAMPPMLAGAGTPPSGHLSLPSEAGIHSAVVRLVDWVSGKNPPKAVLPIQQSGPVPGRQRPVPAAVTRNVARAQGYKPGKGKGQIPAYVFPAVKVKQHSTGPADLGGAASFSAATSTPVASGSTATSKLYRNADGSYTRLESPSRAAGSGSLTFASLAGVGVKDTHVTSVALRVGESWAGRCPSSATVSVTDAAGQRVGRWTGRPSASACAGGWVTVPLSGVGIKALSAKGGGALTVTTTPASSAAPGALAPSPSGTPASPTVPASPTAPASPRVPASPRAAASRSASASPTVPASPTAPASTATASATVLAVTAATTAPPQVNSQWPPDGYNAPSLTPELVATGQTFNGSTPQYQFTIYDSTGTWLTATKWQSADDWVVPAGTLTWGQTYYWTVQVFDSTDTGSATPPMYALSTPVPQPLVSENLAQDGAGTGDGSNSTGPGYDGQNGNFTTQATDASVNVVGPALSVQRTYNSLNGTASGAFGTGWTSVFDMSIRPGRLNSDGSAATLIVTYPDGEQVAFGVNPGTSPQTWTSPQGRFGTIAVPSSGGYELVDKNDTTYVMSQSLGSGAYGISSIFDGQFHTLNFTWTGNEVTKVESAVSQRSLYLTWSLPSGASYPHVATVKTDQVTTGSPSTAITWQYNYSGDQLTGVCNESQSGVPCTQYSYTAGSDYPSAVLDSGPTSYWRLDETSGSTAASSVTANEGADNGTYVNPEFSFGSSPLAGEPSSVAVVGFNGTSSYVQVPSSLGNDGAVRSVSLWFAGNSTSQVLMSQSADPITDSSSSNPYTPIMYIGANGKLEAGFGGTPLSSTSAVDDYNPHNAVLTANGSTETLYIDGKQVASQSLTTTPFIEPYTYLGAGFLGGSNPNEAHSGSTPAATHFNGAMADAATWSRALTAAEVSAMYGAATTPAALVNQITRPSGKIFEKASYAAATSDVTSLTDSNGGSWTVNTPTVSGTSQVYTSAVKGAQPLDYWRLGDTGTSTAVNQVGNGGTATYSNVTQGVSGGPFADTTVDGFNGTSSYLSLPNSLIQPDNESISLWFKTPAGTGQEVLFSSSANSPASGDTANGFTPNIYIGSDGNLNAEFDDNDSPLITSTPVNDGKWHNVVITADATGDEYLYVDGEPVGSVSGETLAGGTAEGQDQVFVGTGFLGATWADQTDYSTVNSTGYPSYFTGDIADVAVYPHPVSAGDVTAMWAAAQHSQGLSPVQTTTVKDPGGHTLTYQYDPGNSGRELSQTDGLGATTTYGYDSGGFQDQVIDPDGDFTDTGYDLRGNVVATTTCQDQSAYKCSTSYASYTPAAQIGQWGTQDEVQYIRDGRSSSATDDTYLTTNTYDSLGDLTSTVTPPVPGSSSGRTTKYSYTDGSTTAGSYNGSAIPPAGLLYQTVSPNGAVSQTLYDAYGDVMKTINPNGVITDYAYDGIGRKTAEAVTSDTESGLTTTYSYDAAGRVVGQTDPGVLDRVTGTTHVAQITTNYDIDGNETSQVTADIGTPTADRDASRTESWTYNSDDQKASYTDGAGTVTDYTYDAYGNLASQTVDPSGADQVTQYAYDPDGRLLTTTLANYTGSPSGSQSAAPLTEQSKAYDPAGRLASVTDAQGRVTDYTYTDNGLTATVTQTQTEPPGSNVTPPTYTEEKDTYDAAGNLVTKVTNNGATTTDYAVDAGNQVTSQTVDPNGLDRVTSYTYDPDDHVTEQNVSQGSSAPIQQTSYTYDAMGNKTSQTVQDPDAEGPVGWWTLGQSSGTSVSDTSGTGNTATATGVTWSGGTAKFSGQGGQDITTRGPVVDTTGSFSVSAWVNLAALTGDDETVVSQDAGSLSGFYLEYDPAQKTWGFELPQVDENDPPDSDWSFAYASSPAKTGTWVFLTGVYSASSGQAELYVNGSESGSATDTSPIVSHGPVEIGADKFDGQTGGDNFDGSIANVEMYPTALSSSEVSNLYGQASVSSGNFGGDLTRGALTTSYQVDELGQVTAETNPDGATTSYQYDQAGHQSEVTEPETDAEANGGAPAASYAHTYSGYNTFGDLADTQDENGNDTYYTYDGDGRQLTKTLPAYTAPGGSTAVNGTTTTVYNTLGEVTSQTDPDGNRTTFAYDQIGHQTSKTDVGTGGVTSSSYDPDGDLLTQTSPTGGQTAATWDFLGRQTSSSAVERYLTAGSTTPSTTPATYTTMTSYTPTSTDTSGTWKSSVTTQDQVTTSYGYDAVGEETRVTDGAGNTTSYSYDALGRQTGTTNPDGTSDTVTYDPAGNKVSESSLSAPGSGGAVTTLSTTSSTYNGEGEQLSATDANGNTSTFTYDAAGDLTAETQPVTSATGIVTSFGYDLAGNQTRYTDGNGNNWYTTYNSRDLPQTQVEPSTSKYTTAANSTTTLSYDGNGNVTSETEPGGVTQTYTYDSLGDVKSQSGSGATATTATRTFSYNNDGEMTAAATSNTAASGSNATSETFSYNDRGMVNGATGSAGTTSLLYNGDGLLQTATDPAGTSSYTYDAADRLKTMADPASGSTLSYAYTPMSQPSTITYGSGDTQTYGYNGLHQLTSDTLANGSTTVASLGYTYDLDGNLTQQVTSGSGVASPGTSSYTYDEASRLISWNNGSTTTSYAYDNDGNRTQAGSTTYSYDARDELTSDGTSAYAYTANGELNTVTSDSTGAVTTSTTDAYGQQGSQGTQSDTYDALGRDVQLASGSTTTSLSYLDTTGQLTSDGTTSYTFTPSGTLTGTAASGSPGSGTLDLTDQHTDVVGQFSASGTSLAGSQSFGPWGSVTATKGTLRGSLGYQSQYTSPVTGQTDMGARWYNPANGDFANKDTASNSPTPNSASASPFGYAADNPLTNTDPTGHSVPGQSITVASAPTTASTAPPTISTQCLITPAEIGCPGTAAAVTVLENPGVSSPAAQAAAKKNPVAVAVAKTAAAPAKPAPVKAAPPSTQCLITPEEIGCPGVSAAVAALQNPGVTSPAAQTAAIKTLIQAISSTPATSPSSSECWSGTGIPTLRTDVSCPANHAACPNLLSSGSVYDCYNGNVQLDPGTSGSQASSGDACFIGNFPLIEALGGLISVTGGCGTTLNKDAGADDGGSTGSEGGDSGAFGAGLPPVPNDSSLSSILAALRGLVGHSDKTAGALISVEADGTASLASEALISGEMDDDISTSIKDYLELDRGKPLNVIFASAEHPDSVLIWNDTANAVGEDEPRNLSMVITNPKGPCTSCLAAIPELLPDGDTLTIYYQDATGSIVSSKPIVGVGIRP
ncbi:MAG TPA: LamG-like jellyroll fold domain-containing protein [Trebonia sp.]|nr:LamG-like jellyroll fold domain-containing protein [Trebonia sp.]